MRLFLTVIILLLTVPGLAAAESISVGDKLLLDLTLPEGWTIHTKAPTALLDEIAEHVEHEAEAAGAQPTRERIYEIAEKRLGANEAIVYHAASGAHLDIDFSPLEADEKAPSDKALKLSAEYASQSLEGDEGVSAVRSQVEPAEVTGARAAFRLTADYKHHEHEMKFLGLIGFAADHWFYLYYTDPQKVEQTYAEMQAIMTSARIRSE